MNDGAARPQAVGDLASRVEQGWERWQRALFRMPADRLANVAVCGEWTAKDLMGHVAVWDAVAIDKVREIQEGIPWQRVATDERNAQEAQARAERSVDEQRAEMLMTHQRLLTALDGALSLPAEKLSQISDVIAEDTWDHYTEHAAEIERWIEDAGT